MANIDLNIVCKLCAEGNIVWSKHALDRMEERGINRPLILRAIMQGEIIKQYLDDKPYPSCLISCTNDALLHVVLSVSDSKVYIITAYIPDEVIWNPDFKSKKER